MIATQSHVNEFREGPHHSACHVANPIIIYDQSGAAFPPRLHWAGVCVCVCEPTARKEPGCRPYLLQGERLKDDAGDCARWTVNLVDLTTRRCFSRLFGVAFCRTSDILMHTHTKQADKWPNKSVAGSRDGRQRSASCLLALISVVSAEAPPTCQFAIFWGLFFFPFTVAHTCHNSATNIRRCQTRRLGKP